MDGWTDGCLPGLLWLIASSAVFPSYIFRGFFVFLGRHAAAAGQGSAWDFVK